MMPYIKQDDRIKIKNGQEPTTPGELNYIITMKLDSYIKQKGISYTNLNEVIGVLECAKLEIYRRITAEYEDNKIAENGDVYTCK